MKITAIPQLYRNLRRWREILAILQRYGLADWLSQHQRLPFSKWYTDHRGTPLSQFTREERVRMAFTDLGPTFIKLGQILAARPDLVGLSISEELKKLRVDVRPDSIETVRNTLALELGDDYEAHFQSIAPTPLASASIGQVHRAVLADGRSVVIKVQRAGLERTVKQDIELLGGLADLAERVETLAAWRPADVVRQLAPMILRELDFSRERQTLEHFCQWVQQHNASVVIPRPVPELCTRRVLVMDELVGQSLADLLHDSGISQSSDSSEHVATNGKAKLEATNGSAQHPERLRLTPERCEAFGQTIADVYLAMIFEEGLFHADPHPGNLFCLQDGRLGILDFGMTGRLDDTLRENIEDMLLAISGGDQNRLIRLIRRVGETPPTLDESALAIDVADFIGTYGSQSIEQFDLTGALNALTDILHRHSIKLPNQSALLLKMLISLEGTLSELGVRFDSMKVVQSLAQKTMMRRLSPRRRMRQARRIYLEAENFLESAPDEVISMMQMVRRGEARLTLEHQRMGPSVNRLVLGLMASSVFVGSSLMMSQRVPPMLQINLYFMQLEPISLFGLLGIIGSIAVMLWLLLAIAQSGHLTRDNED
ncbi:ABC1 kinase family protein [Rhodopirellula sp. MGV]|uniref:ABC1 kinase family protein n=1 Tax=Rhodopirellula sp. MGV TaxID=2023130 RepID=UPI000B964B5D|nr:AarF/UbiB family protein [Rhodopirellula sp. MGV]OYP37135.1 ABC transporter [Rhodopirellula sp. MGV]PNY35635.1 AarF/ABC1/UbiB kinase family protein [Rhodopirellula baltica]